MALLQSALSHRQELTTAKPAGWGQALPLQCTVIFLDDDISAKTGELSRCPGNAYELGGGGNMRVLLKDVVNKHLIPGYLPLGLPCFSPFAVEFIKTHYQRKMEG